MEIEVVSKKHLFVYCNLKALICIFATNSFITILLPMQFPKINIVPLVKSTMEMKSIWQGKTHPKNAASILKFLQLF